MKKNYCCGWSRLRLIFWLPMFVFYFIAGANAQVRQFTITGKVTDATNGQSVPGCAREGAKY